jgi:ribosomal protein S18 acetylase RimI-like enzyme
MARLAAALVLQHRAFDPKRFFLPDDIEAGYARWFEEELAAPGVVLAVAVDEATPTTVRGYAYGRIEARDWNMLLDTHGALHDLYVEEGARGTGMARALVRHVVEALAARGAPRVVLHSAVQNAAAQRLFDQLGFRPTMVEMTLECSDFLRRSGRPPPP